MGETEERLRAALKKVCAEIDNYRRSQFRMSVTAIVGLEHIRNIAFKAYMDLDKKEIKDVEEPPSGSV